MKNNGFAKISTLAAMLALTASFNLSAMHNQEDEDLELARAIAMSLGEDVSGTNNSESAPIEKPLARLKTQLTPLMKAILFDDYEKAHTLIDPQTINSIDECGSTALHLAVETEETDLVLAILQAGADETIYDNQGRQAIDAAREAHIENDVANQEIVEVLATWHTTRESGVKRKRAQPLSAPSTAIACYAEGNHSPFIALVEAMFTNRDLYAEVINQAPDQCSANLYYAASLARGQIMYDLERALMNLHDLKRAQERSSERMRKREEKRTRKYEMNREINTNSMHYGSIGCDWDEPEQPDTLNNIHNWENFF